MRITAGRVDDQEGPVTELFGKVRDQAALAGVLNSLYELHLTLLSVEYLTVISDIILDSGYLERTSWIGCGSGFPSGA